MTTVHNRNLVLFSYVGINIFPLYYVARTRVSGRMIWLISVKKKHLAAVRKDGFLKLVKISRSVG